MCACTGPRSSALTAAYSPSDKCAHATCDTLSVRKGVSSCVCVLNLCIVLAITIYICGVHAVFLAGKSSNVRSYTVYLYGSGQPYPCAKGAALVSAYSYDLKHANTLAYTLVYTHAYTAKISGLSKLSAAVLCTQIEQHRNAADTCVHVHTYTHTRIHTHAEGSLSVHALTVHISNASVVAAAAAAAVGAQTPCSLPKW